MIVKRKRLKPKIKKFLFLFIIYLCIDGFIYSSVNMYYWVIDNKKEKEIIKEINNFVDVKEHIDNENTSVIYQENINEFDPYWDYIKMSLIDVDFNELKKQNPDTAGWLQVGGTNINYPFVQTSDNKFYLNHNFNKIKNIAGWAFMDYRNNKYEYDRNTIIYGHALKSGAIFGTLKNILKENWQNNTNNHIVKLSTETENTLWQVFSVYTVPTTSDYLQTTFLSDEEFLTFANMLKDRSVYNFNTNINPTDKILSLSSCYITSDNKVVLHAKLIKVEKK